MAVIRERSVSCTGALKIKKTVAKPTPSTEKHGGKHRGEHGALEVPALVHRCQPPLKRGPPEAQTLVSVAVLLQPGGQQDTIPQEISEYHSPFIPRLERWTQGDQTAGKGLALVLVEDWLWLNYLDRAMASLSICN